MFTSALQPSIGQEGRSASGISTAVLKLIRCNRARSFRLSTRPSRRVTRPSELVICLLISSASVGDSGTDEHVYRFFFVSSRDFHVVCRLQVSSFSSSRSSQLSSRPRCSLPFRQYRQLQDCSDNSSMNLPPGTEGIRFARPTTNGVKKTSKPSPQLLKDGLVRELYKK